MTLHINESEVRSVLTMAMALEAVEESLRKQARGEVVVQPRRRFELPKGFYHYMARRDARVAAIIGTGGQARTQLEAVAGVRKLEMARAYGRDVARLEKFCGEMAKRLRIPVHPAGSAAEAIKGADIVCTATTAAHPVVTGSDTAAGMHINAIGVNHAHKQELDAEVVGRADLIAVDSIEQSRQEAGDLIMAFGHDESKWSSVKMLADIVDGKIPGRPNECAITLFKSNGIASWDLAVAVRVWTLAREKDLGRKLPLSTNT
jgi:ornithine cyclodeaminase/alanine dehydrogenase-like protein (mu-crystallin family)